MVHLSSLLSASPLLVLFRGLLIRLCRLSSDLLCLPLAPNSARSLSDLIIMHGRQSFTDAQKQHHQPPLRKLRMIDQIRIDYILQIAPSIVW